MTKIVKMDANLANLIAAGEVVEKPSSVVKELVENAIDAHASQIDIFVEESGTLEIKIIDNGDGMSPDDVKLAFLRHATSKIKTEYDLLRIKTLGFRGEAIPSIAAVSQMQIISNDGSNGYQVTYKGGNIQSEGPSPCKKGSTVIVRNLFFNTPARLKYIKSLAKELSAIVFLVHKFAISNPKISFTLYSNQKSLVRSSGTEDYERLFGEIYGLNVAKNIKVIDFEADGCQVKIVYAKPEIYRSNRLDITLVANGRYVKNNAVNQAVMDAYYTQLPIGKAPIVALYLEIDPLLIDVNVHPTKTEIKISNQENICLKIQEELKRALENTIQIPERTLIPPKTYKKESIFNDTIKTPESINVVFSKKETATSGVTILEELPTPRVESFISNEEEIEEVSSPSKLPYLEYIGQAMGCYLLFQNSQGIYLIDQHAAAERISYEYYSAILNSKKQPTSKLLFPLEFEIATNEEIILKEEQQKIMELGIDFLILEQKVSVTEIPLWLEIDRVEDVIRDIISFLVHHRTFDILYFRDTIAKQISCKASIRANKRISPDEVSSLLKQLNKCQNPYHCPHGRPTIITLSNEELEKMFERVVV